MEMPRLTTRKKNKETRPGVKAGVEKKTRPTAAEKEEKLAAEKAAVAKEKAAAKKALNQVAALEDKQRQDDIAYAKTANHPTDRSAPDTPAATAGVATEGRSEARGGDPGSGDDSEPYQPDIVDKVYGVGKHEVAAESAWVGLVAYRLHDWRGNLAAQARKAIDALIASRNDSDEDSDVEVSDAPPAKSPAVTTPASGTAADGGSPVADAVSAIAAAADDVVSTTAPIADDTVPNTDLDAADVVPDAAPDAAVAWDFKTRAGIAAFVKWAMQAHTDSGTNAFHWKTWGDGKDKQGFFQSHLIVYTFAYHLSCLATIPGSYERLTARPIGALLLSAQAVERMLQFWRTGEYKGKRIRVRRATKFMATIEKWDEDRWTELIAAAEEWMELPSRKRSATTSRSASEADDDVMSDDDVVMVMSD
ncbi:hypothetical protein B0H11DRAFT_2373422 [Mycena galericulata]|nr:hypothetical protein B0H11DRAFT_2373422 [Mycena galericulata]